MAGTDCCLKECRLEKLRKLACTKQCAVGPNVQRWAQDILCKDDSLRQMLASFPNRPVSRQCLYGARADQAVSTPALALMICAWGGMRRDHGRRAFAPGVRNRWLCAAERIRRCKLDRKAAYTELQSLRRCGGLPGMGPAFFTKLIHFLMPPDCPDRPVGFIMDRWLVLSANYLCGHTIVQLSGNWVSDANGPETYEKFCRVVEEVARRCNWTPVKAEIAMFDRPGGDWRAGLTRG